MIMSVRKITHMFNKLSEVVCQWCCAGTSRGARIAGVHNAAGKERTSLGSADLG
jgi:hypothetical protein